MIYFFARVFLLYFCFCQFSIYGKQQEEQKCFVILNSIWGMGFFGDFLTVLGALHLFEQGTIAGVSIEYGLGGTYYDPKRGVNWWEYYFEPVNVGTRDNAKIIYSAQGIDIGKAIYDLPRLTEFYIYRKEAHDLIKKYIRLKEPIKQKIKTIIKQSFGHGKVIGVHYRGTDKIHEDPLASFESVSMCVDKVLTKLKSKGHSKIKIFVATDQQSFLDYMIAQYPFKVIFYREGVRSKDNNAVHTSLLTNPYKKGEDALIDCLLLSKTDILIKTSSNLSLCAAYFNPTIPMIHVTSRHWHPPLE